MSKCSIAHCHAPLATCAMGEAFATCPNFVNAEATTGSKNTQNDNAVLFPWTGNALGLDDAEFVAARSLARLIALIGAHNTGKTTFLGALYLLARAGKLSEPGQFAGSYSLAGWEAIAHALSWKAESGPSFPLHTPTGGRYPGMLHWALRKRAHSVTDFLFADAPGEWFRRWALDKGADDAEGARWIAAHAEVFLVFADCEQLGGKSPGSARNALQMLLDRISAECGVRPVALIWSKSDQTVPPAMRTAIEKYARRLIPDIQQFEVSIFPVDQPERIVESYLMLYRWIVDAVSRPVRQDITISSSRHPLQGLGIPK